MSKIQIILITISIGILGGVTFNLLLFPLPWVLGPAFSIAIFTLFGNEVNVPQKLRDPFVGIIGIWLGQSFSSSIFHELNDWLISIMFLFLYVPIAFIITYMFLYKILKVPRVEAFFISSPGGLLEMALGAEECGANSKKVGLIHIIRIFITVFTIPALILLVFPESFERQPMWPSFYGSIVDCFIILILIPSGIFFGTIIKLPGKRLFGPLILSAVLHMTDVIDLDAPIVIFILAQLMVGSFFGSNMHGLNWKIARNYVGLAFGIVVSLIVCMIPFIVFISFFTDAKPEAIILAFAPGGIQEMGLVASSLDIKPAFVVTHHFFRLLIVLIILSIAQKYIYPKLKLLIQNSN